MEPRGSMPHSQGLSNMMSQINPIPRIDTYFLKIHSNIALPSTPRPSYRSLSWDNIRVDLKEIGINTRNWVD